MQSFETARLRMRPLCPEDRTLYCACYTDPELMLHIGEPLSHEAAERSFLAALKMNSASPARRHTWVMQEKEMHQEIGLLALVYSQSSHKPGNADIGAIIFAKFQNKGFAAEAIGALVNIAFASTTLSTLSTYHAADNLAANGLMQKLGFQPDTTQASASTRWLLARSNHTYNVR